MKKFKFNSPEVIKRKIRSVAGQLSPSFDGGILATIMKMIYYQGIKLKEILILKIGDVFSRGRILKRFNPTNPFQLRLLNDYIILIQCHLDYLKENHYSLKNGAPLFPKLKTTGNKNKSSAYKDNKIAKHLKERAGITWEQLRRDGVYHHYLLLAWQGYSNQDIINLLAWYFRENKKEIHTTLKKGGITLSGVNLAHVVQTSDLETATIEMKRMVKKKRNRTKIQSGCSNQTNNVSDFFAKLKAGEELNFWDFRRLEFEARKAAEAKRPIISAEDLKWVQTEYSKFRRRGNAHQEKETNEDGTDLSKPIFDDYFFGDDYDYD